MAITTLQEFWKRNKRFFKINYDFIENPKKYPYCTKFADYFNPHLAVFIIDTDDISSEQADAIKYENKGWDAAMIVGAEDENGDFDEDKAVYVIGPADAVDNFVNP